MDRRLARRFSNILRIDLLTTPGIAVRAFVIVFAAYMFVDGVFAIISGVRAARGGEQWGLLILEGVVDLIIA